jgi:hypothetical protein
VEIKVQKTFEILLDVEKDLYTPSNLLFTVSRNDFESVEVLFTITQDAAPLDLTGKNVDLAIKKPSGLTVYQSIEITDAPDGNAAAMLSLQAYVEFGVHAAEVIVRNESQIMVTCPFYYFSREAIMDGEIIESTGEMSALQEVLFSMDKKPILVDGIPTIVPEYIGQMAFDIGVNKRAFIASDLTETGWQVLGAGESGGGIVDWNSILGKPAAFPPEIHTHDFVDIQAKPAAYPPEAHNHAILDVTGLQGALDAKANTGELGAPVDHTHAIADVTGLQTALDGKADDADLIPFISEIEADAKYALKNEIGGGTVAAAWGEITGTISAQTDLQTALNGKADDADLAGKADAVDLAAKANAADVYAKTETYSKTEVDTALTGKADDADLAGKADLIHSHEIANVNELQNILDAKAPSASPSFTGNAVFNGTGAVAKFISPSMTNALYFSLFGLDIDGITQLQRGYFGIGSGSTPNTITLASTRGDVELKPKSGFVVDATAPIKESGTLLSEKYAPSIHNHTIENVTGLQTALDGKADDADLTGKADLADLAAKANSADVYQKIETYTKTEVDAIASGITEGGGTIVQDNLSSVSSSAALSANQGRILNETKADIADLTAKANSADVYAKTETYNKTELDADLAGKANTADLAAKADAIHSHAIADVTGLQAVLDGKADDADLAGKADAVHTHTFAQIADKPALYPPEAHNHAILDVTGLQAALDGKADDADLAAKANTADVYTKTATYNKTEVDTALTGKANTADLAAKANSADVYPKTGTYSKTEIDTALTGKADAADLAAKANTADLAAKANSADVYLKTETFTKTEVNTALAGKADDADLAAKANTADLAAKANSVDVYTKTEIDTALTGKADDADLAGKANSADVYLKTATYSKTEVDTALTGKANTADLAAYITEANADLKYEPIGAGGGGAWGEITGTISAQTDLQTALNAKADDADLAGKADAVHTHTIANVTGLQTALDGKITSTYADAGDNFIMNTKMAGLTLWKGTQAAYDALTKDSNTLYFITG